MPARSGDAGRAHNAVAQRQPSVLRASCALVGSQVKCQNCCNAPTLRRSIVFTSCHSASDKADAAGLSLYRFAKDEPEEFIEKNAAIRDSLAKQLLHNSKGSGSMHRSNSAREESESDAVSSIGEIDFRGVIMLRLISCKDLPRGGSYARFTLGKQSLKSKTVTSSNNPTFNEVLMLSWDGRARLRGVVYATSLFGKDEEIGNVDVNLAERSSFENLPLQPSVTASFNRFVRCLTEMSILTPNCRILRDSESGSMQFDVTLNDLGH